MATTIDLIKNYVEKYAEIYGYKYPGIIIAQAVLESGINGSGLSKKANNFWGMKCGSSWHGKSINMKTQEYYNGYVTIRDNFRAYDSVEDGVKGYFEFIQKPRYANLKDATSPEDYATKIRQDGWATSPTYTQNLIKIYRNYAENLGQNTPKDKTPVIDAVKNLQTKLNDFGGYGLAVDGIIGPKTTDAYNKFRRV